MKILYSELTEKVSFSGSKTKLTLVASVKTGPNDSSFAGVFVCQQFNSPDYMIFWIFLLSFVTRFAGDIGHSTKIWIRVSSAHITICI